MVTQRPQDRETESFAGPLPRHRGRTRLWDTNSGAVYVSPMYHAAISYPGHMLKGHPVCDTASSPGKEV
jgi:hypothetical protein